MQHIAICIAIWVSHIAICCNTLFCLVLLYCFTPTIAESTYYCTSAASADNWENLKKKLASFKRLFYHKNVPCSVSVFDADKTVSLPPHVRLPSPQRNTEPVVGSRKRKARKHSITHLIPVPQSLLLNGKSVDIYLLKKKLVKDGYVMLLLGL